MELELQALKQQKDHAEAKAKTMENRQKFRKKLKSISDEPNDLPEVEPEERKVQFKEEQLYVKEHIKQEFEEELRNDLEEEEEKFLASHEEEIDPMEEKIFKAQVKALSVGANKETKKLFHKITNNYDNRKSISDNLNSMASEIKELIKKNTRQIKKNDEKIQKEKAEREKELMDKQIAEEKSIEEIKAEQKYKSQLNSLMRLR